MKGAKTTRALRTLGKRKPGERAGLDVEAVLTEARALSEAEGIESLTMRRLAQRLGVAPNSLYSHFADKSALLDELMDFLLLDIDVPNVDKVGWRDGLADLMESTRKFLLAHADLIPRFLSRPRRGPNAIRLGEATLSLLGEAGLQEDEAVDGLRILLIYTFGFAAQEAPRRDSPDPELRLAESESAYSSVGDAPLTRKLARPLSQHPSDETFKKGLLWLLQGVQAAATRQQATPDER